MVALVQGAGPIAWTWRLTQSRAAFQSGSPSPHWRAIAPTTASGSRSDG